MKRTEQERSTPIPIQERSMQSPIQERPIHAVAQERSMSMPMQATTPSASRERSMQSSVHPGDLQEAIRIRAYQIYEQRGRAGGSEIEDWLQAEAELLDNQGRRRAA